MLKAGYGAKYVHTDYDQVMRIMEKFTPYGIPGDELWVREAWSAPSEHDSNPPREIHKTTTVQYTADGASRPKGMWADGRQRPSIHMPRWASRLQLVVKDVSVERLQDISEEDAEAEGIKPIWQFYGTSSHKMWEDYRGESTCLSPASFSFETLWDSINGKFKGRDWKSNCFVAAVEFELKEKE